MVILYDITYIYIIKLVNQKTITMKTLNGKKTATGFQVKWGFIPESEILGINAEGQVEISDEAFEDLAAKRPIKKRMKLAEIVAGIVEQEGNGGKKWNPISKQYESYGRI